MLTFFLSYIHKWINNVELIMSVQLCLTNQFSWTHINSLNKSLALLNAFYLSWMLVLNNQQRSVFQQHYDLTVKLTFVINSDSILELRPQIYLCELSVTFDPQKSDQLTCESKWMCVLNVINDTDAVSLSLSLSVSCCLRLLGRWTGDEMEGGRRQMGKHVAAPGEDLHTCHGSVV